MIEKEFEKACNFVMFEGILNNQEELEKRAWGVFEELDEMNSGLISKKQLFVFMQRVANSFGLVSPSETEIESILF